VYSRERRLASTKEPAKTPHRCSCQGPWRLIRKASPLDSQLWTVDCKILGLRLGCRGRGLASRRLLPALAGHALEEATGTGLCGDRPLIRPGNFRQSLLLARFAGALEVLGGLACLDPFRLGARRRRTSRNPKNESGNQDRAGRQAPSYPGRSPPSLPRRHTARCHYGSPADQFQVRSVLPAM
jgi:hypothetical protein